MPTPTTAWHTLRIGNENCYTSTRSHRNTASAQPPVALVFRCADAGPASNVIFGQSFTSIIEVSIWGHVIDTGVLATVDHAVGTLQVPLILVLGHQNCAAMHTALKVWNDGQDLPQSATRAAVEQATTSILHRASGAVSADLLEAGHVVEAGLALLQKSPVLARAVDTGRSAVICALTEDSDNGRVRVCATIGDVDDQTQDLLECV